jgi:hypothetical protein
MLPSSRTPEGSKNHCPICGKDVCIEPFDPAGDGTCPYCGCLLWFNLSPEINSDARSGALAPRDGIFLLKKRPQFAPPKWYRRLRRISPRLAQHFLRRKQARAAKKTLELLAAAKKCKTRQELETMFGLPLYAFSDLWDGTVNLIVEGYYKDGCRIELGFAGGTHYLTSAYSEAALISEDSKRRPTTRKYAAK